MKWSEFYKPATFLIIMLVFSSSCTEKDSVVPDYVGTWSAAEPISLPGITTPYWHVITFTGSTFFDALQVQIPKENLPEKELLEEAWTDKVSAKGSISFNENLITRTITEIGINSLSLYPGLPIHDWDIFKDHQQEFDRVLTQWGLTKTTVSQFTVVGHQLTLQTDLNRDGDYEDEYEEIVYKKDSRPVRY